MPSASTAPTVLQGACQTRMLTHVRRQARLDEARSQGLRGDQHEKDGKRVFSAFEYPCSTACRGNGNQPGLRLKRYRRRSSEQISIADREPAEFRETMVVGQFRYGLRSRLKPGARARCAESYSP